MGSAEIGCSFLESVNRVPRLQAFVVFAHSRVVLQRGSAVNKFDLRPGGSAVGGNIPTEADTAYRISILCSLGRFLSR